MFTSSVMRKSHSEVLLSLRENILTPVLMIYRSRNPSARVKTSTKIKGGKKSRPGTRAWELERETYLNVTLIDASDVADESIHHIDVPLPTVFVACQQKRRVQRLIDAKKFSIQII